ncbi:MAG TPA: DUF4922 domain-containing protein [Blastocatellia bacterium]|nr:DUF4922 domain-containing protein [Blastocatellia bacterium]
MSWETRIVYDRDLGPYLQADDSSLATRVTGLVEHQKATWPMLREGYDALDHAEMKQLNVDGSFVLVQHNPRRIRSTAARVDRESVEQRGCFLCPDKLPAEEKALLYGDEFLLLCNPLPVLYQHLSVVHRDHVEQQVLTNIGLLLSLAADLGPQYLVLYNGPECGASAPDHLHFQACRRSALPIETALGSTEDPPAESCDICDRHPRDDFELFTMGDSGRTAIVFRATVAERMAAWVHETLAELGRRSNRLEPMVNILCSHDGEKWTVIIFPRARHRPACFYAEGDSQLLVSPGAIDMAGVIVVPHREHFDRIGPDEVQAIYSEVSMPEDEVNDAVERVCELAGAGD